MKAVREAGRCPTAPNQCMIEDEIHYRAIGPHTKSLNSQVRTKLVKKGERFEGFA